MRRDERLDVMLTALTAADPFGDPVFVGLLESQVDTADPEFAFATATQALARLWLGQVERGAALAQVALAAASANPGMAATTAADEVDALTFARAVAGWALAEWAPAHSVFGDPIGDALADPRPVSASMRAVCTVLLAEAAFANIQVGRAAKFSESIDLPDALFGRTDHPFLTFMRLTPARVRVLAGDLTGAQRMIETALATAPAGPIRMFTEAHAAMLMPPSEQRVATRQAVRAVSASGISPRHLFTRGVFVIAAYAAMTQHDTAAAAQLVLRAGIDARLSNLRVSDRVICLEILVRAALDADDLDAARAWRAQAQGLAKHPIADSTVHRINARIALAAHDAARALRQATRASQRAREDGRGLELIESQLLTAEAMIRLGRTGDAVRSLAELMPGAELRGLAWARRSASRALRGTGRRIPPSREQGWDGLSKREREIALLVASGASNAEIGAQLFLSTHTIREHVSRLLYAFDTPTRAGIAAKVPNNGAIDRVTMSTLTPRQREVAALIATGASNHQIAARLGVGQPTVEKHVTAILQRWQLRSRAGIARACCTETEPGASPPE